MGLHLKTSAVHSRAPLGALGWPVMADAAGLVTDPLILRRWREEDREPFAAMNADLEVMRWYPAPLSRAKTEAFVDRAEACFAAHGWGLWAVEADGHFIGTRACGQ